MNETMGHTNEWIDEAKRLFDVGMKDGSMPEIIERICRVANRKPSEEDLAWFTVNHSQIARQAAGMLAILTRERAQQLETTQK